MSQLDLSPAENPGVANTAQDDAPDIYETPDLADDASTVPVRPVLQSVPLSPLAAHPN